MNHLEHHNSFLTQPPLFLEPPIQVAPPNYHFKLTFPVREEVYQPSTQRIPSPQQQAHSKQFMKPTQNPISFSLEKPHEIEVAQKKKVRKFVMYSQQEMNKKQQVQKGKTWLREQPFSQNAFNRDWKHPMSNTSSVISMQQTSAFRRLV